jgi:hypothetical protein
MAMRTILAVAIGKPSNNQVITAMPPATSLIRPYINGLISWLANQTSKPDPDPDNPLNKYDIGTDYQIDYRECDLADVAGVFAAQGAAADLLFCMSTTVARAAYAYTTTKPIVAIVSDPFSETYYDANVWGTSAGRDRLVRHALKQFRKKHTPKLTKIYALHRKDYPPSTKSIAWLGNDKVKLWPVADTENIQVRIQAAIDDPPTSAVKGFLILPADRFFGAAPDIVSWTGTKPTFWTTPDFPVNPVKSFGGYGYPQVICGQFMAERVAGIWTSQDAPVGNPVPLPDPKWTLIDPKTVDVRPGGAGPLAKSKAKKAAAKKQSAKKSGKKSAKKPAYKARKKK